MKPEQIVKVLRNRLRFAKIENNPTEITFLEEVIKAVEVRHGEWVPDYETFVDEWERESEPIQTGWVCSLCGRQEWKKEPYCNCGAKMDGKGENNGNL